MKSLTGFSKKYEVKVFLQPGAFMPFKKRASDGGFDFHILLHGPSYTLAPGETKKFRTGVHCRFPANTVWQWDVRSSVGLRGLSKTCATVDSSYTGELHVVIANTTTEPITVENGERLSQLVPNPFSENFYLSEVKNIVELGKTDRGGLGFGSSGK